MTPAQLIALIDSASGPKKRDAKAGTMADALAFGSGSMAGGG